MRRKHLLAPGLFTLAAVALVVGLGTAGAHPPVTGVVPASFSSTAAPGDTFTVNKVVHTPAIPPKLDFVLDVDNSGSYGDDKPTIVALAPGLATAITTAVPDTQFGLTTFVDFPFPVWGFAPSGDYAYARNLDLTASTSAWTAAISAMIIRNGFDGPESQYESLFQAATGAGRDVPPAGPSLGDIPAGQGVSFRPAATKVIAITTDAPFHNAGDGGGPFPYPGASSAATIAALNAAGIKIIALKAPGSGSEMDALALATGGSVHTTSSSSAGIAAAILAGLGNLPVTVMPSATCAPELSITFSPTGPVTVTSGADVAFTETITVSLSATPGSYGCTVDFLLDGNKVAGFTQTVSIDVVDRTPPSAECAETNNPSGGNVPTSGPNAGKSGQNPDGFYVVRARDNFDPNPKIYVGDSASAAVFGAFVSGTKLKITQAPGVTPNQKPGSGDIDWKLQLKGDALVWAVDAAGNMSAVQSCKVPPPPK